MRTKNPNIRRILRYALLRRIVARIANGVISITITVFVITFLTSLVLLIYARFALDDISSVSVPQIGSTSSRFLDVILLPLRLIFIFFGFLHFLMILLFHSIVLFLCMLTIGLYIGFFFLPFLLTLPLTGPLAMLWKKPGHFLLLRPFNRRWITRPLGRILRREVGRFGHIYTLADANIRVPMYVRVPIVFGQLSFFMFRRRRIRKPIHIERLKHAMRKRWIRNLNWCLSRSRMFPVACTDAYWQDCVAGLLSEVDIILIDISDVSKNVLWEINLCLKMGISDRTLVFLHELDREETVAELRVLLGEQVDRLNLFAYGKRGLEDAGRFRSIVAGMLFQINIKEVQNV